MPQFKRLSSGAGGGVQRARSGGFRPSIILLLLFSFLAALAFIAARSARNDGECLWIMIPLFLSPILLPMYDCGTLFLWMNDRDLERWKSQIEMELGLFWIWNYMQLLDSFVVCLSEDLVFLAVNACLLFFFFLPKFAFQVWRSTKLYCYLNAQDLELFEP